MRSRRSAAAPSSRRPAGSTPDTVVVYATIKGLHYVSMGALTHSAPNPRPLPPPRDHAMTLLQLDNIPAMQAEVRALARERGAVILAHNYQLPEVQDVADYVGDSLGLSSRPRRADEDVIAFCGVHFMAETASILSPEKTVLLPDLDAGCSLADCITAEQLRAWKAKHPGRARRDVRQHDRRGQGGDRLLRDLVERGRGRRAHLPRARRGHRDPLRPRHVPRRLRREGDRAARCTSGTASATSTPASARATSPTCAPRTRAPTS